jgi:hypothetical protein
MAVLLRDTGQSPAVISALVGVAGTIATQSLPIFAADKTLKNNVSIEILKSTEPMSTICDKLNLLIETKMLEKVEKVKQTTCGAKTGQ